MNTKQQSPLNNSLSTITLIEQEQPGRMRWWHRIAAPGRPSDTATLNEREAYRRGKYISNTLLAMIILFIVQLVVIGGLVNHGLVPIFIMTLIVIGIAIVFNKRGKIILSGILVVLAIDASVMLAFPTYVALTPYQLTVLDLLVLPEVFAVSLLPAYFVFFDMGFHILFIFCVLTFLFSKDAQLTAYLAQAPNFIDAAMKPTLIQVVVAIVSYTWMSSIKASVNRADRATEFALIEKDIAERNQLAAQQKRLLEKEIQEIIQVHSQVANGQIGARVPLRQGNMLWSVAGSLNNLLTRLQKSLKEAQQLQQTNVALSLFFHARNKAGNGPIIFWKPTGTAVDILVQQHNAMAQFSSSSPHK